MTELSISLAKPEEQELMASLMQYYLYDFSEFDAVSISPDGKFSYPYLSFYWRELSRFPYLFRLQDQPVGFALLRNDTNPVDGEQFMDLAEFFIMRSHRRKGLGTFAAMSLWDLLPNSWQVSVLRTNHAAYNFWQPLITDYTRHRFDLGSDSEKFIFTFRSRATF